MCQLCFITKPKDSNFNPIAKQLFARLMVFNSIKNPDGWGIWAEGKLTKYAACVSDDMERFVKELPDALFDTTPVLAHVRYASTNKGKIVDEFAHPFMGENIVLAHNGTLTPKKGVVGEDTIDSLMFTKTLDEVINKDRRIALATCIKKAYEEFTGKFAFLIHHISKNEYYIVRGKTANLHVATVYVNGEEMLKIINTEKDTLEISLELMRLDALLNGHELSFSVEEVPQETINKITADGNLVKVDALVETYRAWNNTNDNYWDNFDYNRRSQLANATLTGKEWGVPGSIYVAKDNFSRIEILYTIIAGLQYHGVTIDEIRGLMLMIYGHDLDTLPIFEVDIEDFKKLLEEFTPKKAVEWYKVWSKFSEKYSDADIFDLYRQTNIQFPFWLSSERSIRKAVRRI